MKLLMRNESTALEVAVRSSTEWRSYDYYVLNFIITSVEIINTLDREIYIYINFQIILKIFARRFSENLYLEYCFCGIQL